MGRNAIALHSVARNALQILGGLVKVARIEKGWTQQRLADIAGTSQRTVSLVERGNPAVSVGTALNIAVVAGVPLFQTSDPEELARLRYRGQEKLGLLPQKVVLSSDTEEDYDF